MVKRTVVEWYEWVSKLNPKELYVLMSEEEARDFHSDIVGMPPYKDWIRDDPRIFGKPIEVQRMYDVAAMEQNNVQALPTPNTQPFIQDLVLADILKRKQVGIERYGTALQPFNGRDMLRDLYEELVDACVYIRGVMFERDGK